MLFLNNPWYLSPEQVCQRKGTWAAGPQYIRPPKGCHLPHHLLGTFESSPNLAQIFICDSQLKREHQRRKHSLFCYKCMSHSQVPGYLLQCVPWQGFPRAGTFIIPLYSEGWSFSPKETPGDVYPLSGTACFQKTCRNNLPWRSGLF